MAQYNQRTALAFHFGCDYRDIEWYQPRAGQKVKLFASGNSYYCAVKTGTALPPGYDWKQEPDGILNPLGWEIWKAQV